MNMKIPNSLIPVSFDKVRKEGKTLEKGLFFLDSDFDSARLYLFGPLIEIHDVNRENFFICPQGIVRNEWSIKPARERSKDLWGSFSEMLIMKKLEGCEKEYEIHCGQAESISGMTVRYDNAYFMQGNSKKNGAAGFYFGAKEMVRLANVTDLSDNEIMKLTRFLITDYYTNKYSRESKKIGLEADSVFF